MFVPQTSSEDVPGAAGAGQSGSDLAAAAREGNVEALKQLVTVQGVEVDAPAEVRAASPIQP